MHPNAYDPKAINFKAAPDSSFTTTAQILAKYKKSKGGPQMGKTIPGKPAATVLDSAAKANLKGPILVQDPCNY